MMVTLSFALILLFLKIFESWKATESYEKKEVVCNNPDSPMNNWMLSELDPETIVPWEDVLTNRFIPDYTGDFILCPKCIGENRRIKDGEEFISENINVVSKNIITVHFKSNDYAWENFCGREGNLSICLKHKRQIDFDYTMMN